jgi:glycosyltransferase involved in cell wall biosynthesis
MLYLYRGWFSGINQALLEAWKTGCAELEIKPIDVFPITGSNLLRGLPDALKRGGFGILIPGGGRLKDALKGSKWCMQAIQKEVLRLYSSEDFDFSLTISTILPVIKPMKPNFIYTDFTIMANLYYPQGEERVNFWKECLSYERETLENATMVFTMSRHVSRSLEEHYMIPKEKIIRVNAGCNVPHLPTADNSRFKSKRILFIGVDWDRKGGPELVEAFRRLQKRHPTAKLTIVGCKPKLSAPGVEIVGRISQEEVCNFLNSSAVFCLPSKREAFGIAYIEAMRTGLPVIALNLGAVPDFIINGENGYMLHPGNIDDLSIRIEELITDPDKCELMGKKGQQIVETEYTWARTQQRMWQSIRKNL